MFSHVIHNPNKFFISKDYDVVPIGYRCSSAIACKFANIRKFSLPFDWTAPLNPAKIIAVLENNYDDFVPDVHKGIFMNKYNIYLAHFDSDINNGIAQYKRRIERLKFIMKTPKKKYFIYINEDYLYSAVYREDNLNDLFFNEILDFEKYIRKHYINIDYNILYFNFKQHTIPEDSNIINIVLHSKKLYNDYSNSPFDKFRIYCSKILGELFNTKLQLVYDERMFNS